MRYPWLKVRALQGDYLAGLELSRSQGSALFVFLGGTLGNFKSAEAGTFPSERTRAITAASRSGAGKPLRGWRAALLAASGAISGVAVC
jgi:uncharacterized SAM-dependent methyltransferase